MQQEIERVQVGQLKALDLAFADSGEVSFDALGGDFAREYRVMLGFERDQADVGSVAFVPRSRVSDFDQLHFHHPSQTYRPQSAQSKHKACSLFRVPSCAFVDKPHHFIA
jgi:hypothetical protein